MASQLGKKFEDKFKEDWDQYLPGTVCFRLHDQMNGYKIVSQNPCDYICFASGSLFLCECKSHGGKSFPFSALTQYDKLLEYKGKADVFPVVIIWLTECDRVLGVPITSVEQMIADGKKSVNLNDFGKYKMFDIPSTKKRVFMDSDYSKLVEWLKGSYD